MQDDIDEALRSTHCCIATGRLGNRIGGAYICLIEATHSSSQRREMRSAISSSSQLPIKFKARRTSSRVGLFPFWRLLSRHVEAVDSRGPLLTLDAEMTLNTDRTPASGRAISVQR
jgi:hypothetical protein